MSSVTQIYPSKDQVRERVETAVREAVCDELTATRLGRYRNFHLTGALEGVVDALAFLCIAWTEEKSVASARTLAGDCSVMLQGMVDDMVTDILKGAENADRH